jgi:hypothetical protein
MDGSMTRTLGPRSGVEAGFNTLFPLAAFTLDSAQANRDNTSEMRITVRVCLLRRANTRVRLFISLAFRIAAHALEICGSHGKTRSNA